MEEGTKVRLVRCPKCENLLPELPNVSLYQCGGCGAVLQAKKHSTSSEGSLEERVLPDGTADSNSTSSSRIENIAELKHDGRSLEQETENIGKYRRSSKDPVDGWVIGNDHEMNRNREKSVRTNMEKDIGALNPQMGIASGSKGSTQIPNWRSRERDGSIAYRRTPRAVAEDVRFLTSPYPGEGTSNSNYHSGSYGLGEPLKNQNNPGGLDRVEHLEQDRAELIRKLDELKDQLARSCEVSDKPKVPLDGRTIPVDPYVGRDTWFPEGSARPHRSSMQSFPADNHPQRPHYSNHGPEHFPLMNRPGMDMQNFYSPVIHAPNEIPGYGDPFAPQMVASNHPHHQYQPHPSHNYFPAQYMDFDRDHNASYPQNTFFHQPACSCLNCYNKHVSAEVPPRNRRFPDGPTNPMFYHLENHGALGPRGYNPRDVHPPPVYSLEPQPRVRRDLDKEINGFGQSRPRRVAPAKRNGRRCCPIAGGAPFITCNNCFELLPIPRKLLLMDKNHRKLRCGGCSTIISFLVESKGITVSTPAQIKGISSVVNDGSVEEVKEELVRSHGQANRRSTYSSDYDNSGYQFHSTDPEPGSSSMDRRLNLSESEKLEGLVSSCSTTSEDEESPDSVIARRELSNSAELPLKAKGTPPLPSSPLRGHAENSSSNQVGNKFEKGNRSKRTNQEELVLTKATSRQNSVKDASVATEMDVSYNEYSNTGMSQDSGEVSREEDQLRVSKGGDSYFLGLIKKSFRDLSRSNQTGDNGKSDVLVNGQPISERLVKKAEKLAGPIYPGQYWYDFRAGFWGLMGQPCLGIIPPFIEEFNYPMPKKCAGGNTGIFVNGRELHQKDLDLLSNRGLPTTADKSYIIEISGRVLNEDSAEELDSLGKLAPTVERLKRGFGMRSPRAAAA